MKSHGVARPARLMTLWCWALASCSNTPDTCNSANHCDREGNGTPVCDEGYVWANPEKLPPHFLDATTYLVTLGVL